MKRIGGPFLYTPLATLSVACLTLLIFIGGNFAFPLKIGAVTQPLQEPKPAPNGGASNTPQGRSQSQTEAAHKKVESRVSNVSPNVQQYLSLGEFPYHPSALPADLTRVQVPEMQALLTRKSFMSNWNMLLFAIANLAEPSEAYETILKHFEHEIAWGGDDVSGICFRAGCLQYLGWLPSDVGGPYLRDFVLEWPISGDRSLHARDMAIVGKHGLTSPMLFGALRGLILLQDDAYMRPVFDRYVQLSRDHGSELHSFNQMLKYDLEAQLVTYLFVKDNGREVASRILAGHDIMQTSEPQPPYLERLRAYKFP